MRLRDQKVLITGGSAGIGLALTTALKATGNQVTIAARGTERLNEVARAFPGIVAVRCDVSQDADLERLVETARREMGGVSVLINNAGIQFNDRYAREARQSIVDHVTSEVGVNFAGLVKLTALVLPLLREEREAAVVNVSSVLALAPKKSAPVYCATKAAVSSFTKSLRYQLREDLPHVRVIDVLPPAVDTAMTKGRGGPKVTPESVADAIIAGIERERHDVRIGLAKTLAAIKRVSPGLADRLVRDR